MKTVSECIGENLRRLRQERDLTQEAFAKKAGLSLSFLQTIEHGKKWAGPKTITAIAKALNVAESDLFQDCEKQPEPDPKQMLLMMCRAFGINITDEAIAALKVRKPFTAYIALYDSMPDQVCLRLTELSQQPGWDWESFTKKIGKPAYAALCCSDSRCSAIWETSVPSANAAPTSAMLLSGFCAAVV
jgi:transcriptional regulator with XRE-family HTH domain